MADEFYYLYPYSREEAKRLNELSLWRESHKENVACKNAIEEAIRQNFDGMHLNADCAESVISQHGFKGMGVSPKKTRSGQSAPTFPPTRTTTTTTTYTFW